MVKIILREKPTNRPIPAVPVYIESEITQYRVSIDNNGEGNINLNDGKYVVKVRSSNHRPYTKKHYLSRNSILEIQLEKAFV